MNTITASHDKFDHRASREAPRARGAAWRDLPITKKLVFCLLSIMTLSLAIGLAGLLGTVKVGQVIESGTTAGLASIVTGQASTRVAQMQLHSERYMASGDPSDLKAARAAARSAGDTFVQVAIAPYLQKSPRAAELNAMHARISEHEQSLARLARDGRGADDVIRSGDSLLKDAVDLNTDMSRTMEKASDQLPSQIAWTIGTIFVLLLLSVANALAVGRHISREIAGRIKEINAAMIKLADGDKDAYVPCADRRDEIGDMARSLDVFRRGYLKLDALRAEQAAAAEAELASQAQQQREKEELRAQQSALLVELANKFERTVGDVVGGVAAASTQLQLTASSMAASAEQSAMQATDVSTALTEASGGVTAAAAASDEFAMSIGEISRQAATSAELARKATLSAADADATISTLSESAQQVGQIVELISTIAQRTNLLALNASIEAARGGEAGRGFAVVASEVKELAAQTSKATDEVAAQIRAIQESTGASVAALRAIGQQVEQLEATSVSIAAAVDQQSVAGQDLARSIDLAARSTDDVTSNIVNVRETSLATGAAASQVLTSSTELEQQAVTLKTQVDEFLSHVRAA